MARVHVGCPRKYAPPPPPQFGGTYITFGGRGSLELGDLRRKTPSSATSEFTLLLRTSLKYVRLGERDGGSSGESLRATPPPLGR